MARYKKYDYDQLQMVAVSLDNQLMPGTLEFAIHRIIEERLDTSIFDSRFKNDVTGRTAYNPRILLKIILLGYARGMLGSRKIERACKENITFMALTCGQSPDHSTIAEFVSSMGDDEVEALFTQVLLVCEEEGLLGGTHFSLDGVKLSSNASKESSGTHQNLRKKQEKLTEKVNEALAEHRAEDQCGGDRDGQRQQQRIEKLEKQVDRIEKYLKESKPKMGRRGKEIQGNITDPESAKMATSHGVVQGYNANALVDEKHQIVVYAEAMGEGDDGINAAPMLAGAAKVLTAVGSEEKPLKDRTLSADTSYYSHANLRTCEEYEVDAFIPDTQFRKRDPRFEEAGRHRRSVDRKDKRCKSKKRWFTVDDFTWDDELGKLICPAGHPLYRNGKNFESDGCMAKSYRARKTDCRDCRLRAKCMRHPEKLGTSRQVRIFDGKRPGSLTDAMKAKIDTPEGRRTYSKRLGIVEPVFGNIRSQKGMDRFTLRSKKKVNIQWTLYCMVHNLEKIGKYGKGMN